MLDTPQGILPMTAVLPQAFGPDHLTESARVIPEKSAELA